MPEMYSTFFKTLHSCKEKLGKLVLMVFYHSNVASLIDLSINLVFNSWIDLGHRCFVLTLKILFGRCDLETKSLEVRKFSIVTVFLLERRNSTKQCK